MKFTLPELAGTARLAQDEIARLTAALDEATRAAPVEHAGLRAKYGTRRTEARRFIAEACAQDAAPKPLRKVGRALQPNVGIALAYRDKLLRAIDDMHRSVAYWVVASYDRVPPATIAQDELSFRVMQGTIRELVGRWMRKFDDMALYLAGYFATAIADRTDDELKKILAEGGLTIEPKATRAQRDALGAIVRENVSLIRSIPQRYLADVEQDVMRSIQSGGDMKALADTLQERYGATRKRAALIARDQNTKATAMLQRVRFVESGITEAIWMHSSAGKTPRPTHLKAGQDKQRFDPAEGWYDPHEDAWILPGQLINCRCTCRPVFDKLPTGRIKPGKSPLGVKWGA